MEENVSLHHMPAPSGWQAAPMTSSMITVA
jgi:hypothetical protein